MLATSLLKPFRFWALCSSVEESIPVTSVSPFMKLCRGLPLPLFSSNFPSRPGVANLHIFYWMLAHYLDIRSCCSAEELHHLKQFHILGSLCFFENTITLVFFLLMNSPCFSFSSFKFASRCSRLLLQQVGWCRPRI